MDDREARERVARVETLLEEIDSLRDPDAREKATEVVRALLDLYGEGVAGIEADDGAATPRLIQLEVAEPLRRSWERVDAIPQGGWLIKEVSGEPLLFLNVDGSHYAYRPSCPACEASLGDAVVSGAELLCSECGSRYDVVRAGRCLDAPELHLDPVPLLVEDGAIKVALGSL